MSVIEKKLLFLEQNGVYSIENQSFNYDNYSFLNSSDLALSYFQDRNSFTHKGNYGHGLLISGSENYCGAAILCAKAALVSGIGLLTIEVPKLLYPIIQTTIWEAICKKDKNKKFFTKAIDTKAFSAIGIGPGLGKAKQTKKGLINLLQKTDKPIVIDADGLNILSQITNFHNLIKNHSCVITPHIKEFERLFGSFGPYNERIMFCQTFCHNNNVVICLKDAITTIITPQKNVYFNLKGNSGMATGGSGDVLTGIIFSLLSQKYSPIEATKLGVYLHSLSGDLARQQRTEACLIASNIIEFLPQAIKAVKQELKEKNILPNE